MIQVEFLCTCHGLFRIISLSLTSWLNSVMSDSEEEVAAPKKSRASSGKVTPSTVGGAKKASTTPTKGEGKKEIKSISDFFGKDSVKRATRSTRNNKGGENSAKLEKRKTEDEGGQEVRTIPESPTEAAVMEFSDEAVALALQEEELEMQKEKVRHLTAVG